MVNDLQYAAVLRRGMRKSNEQKCELCWDTNSKVSEK